MFVCERVRSFVCVWDKLKAKKKQIKQLAYTNYKDDKEKERHRSGDRSYY